MIQSGKLDKRITLQSCSVGKGVSGGMTKQWMDFAAGIPAAIRHLSGNERRASKAGGQVAIARTEVTMRWIPGVDASMRVVFEDAAYNIQHVSDVMARREMLILTCDTGMNDG